MVGRYCCDRISSHAGEIPCASPPGQIPSQLPPLAVGLDQIPLNFLLECEPGDPLPDSLNFPLGCGPGPDPLNCSIGCGPGPDSPQLPLGCGPGDPSTRSPSP